MAAMYMKRLEGDDMLVPWVAAHAAGIINRFQLGTDGRTAYPMLTGERILQKARPSSGGASGIWKPYAEGNDKADVRMQVEDHTQT